MNKKKVKNEIKSLDFEIRFVQIEKFINNFNKAMNKNIKNSFKKIFVVTTPLILSLIGYFIFKNPIILTIGTSITGINFVITISTDFIKDMKHLTSSSDKSDSNILDFNKEKNIEQILTEKIGNKKAEDFYSEKYKSIIKQENQIETEQEKKYRETLEKQKNQNNINLKVLKNNTNYLNKEETMIQMVKEIDAYTIAYNLPPLNISNEQWELFFNTTYDFFQKKGLENKFYNQISEMARLVYSKALLNNQEKICVYDFVKNLYYLENETIKKQEIVILQQDLLSKIQSEKIINFSDYTTEKKRK